jgi:hypothetical protein
MLLGGEAMGAGEVLSAQFLCKSKTAKKKNSLIKNNEARHSGNVYNFSYSGGRDRESRPSRPAWGIKFS